MKTYLPSNLILVIVCAFLLLVTSETSYARDNCSAHASEGYRCVQGFNGCPNGERMGDYDCNQGQWCCKQGGTGSKTGPTPTTINMGPDLGPKDMYALFTSVIAKLQSLVGYLALIFLVIGGIMYIFSSVNENMKKMANACISASLIGLVLAALAPTLLKEIQQVVFAGGMPRDINQIPTVKSIVLRALGVLLSIVGSLAIMGLVVSGIMYVTAFGNKSQADKAKAALTYSLIGIIIASLSLILVRQIVQLITG